MPARAARRRSCTFEHLEPRVVLAATPLITEFVALNRGTIADEDGDWSDWIEIHNPGSEPLNLAGYYLTDNAARLDKWRFSGVTLPPGGYRVVFASGKDRSNPAGALHANFALESGGEYLALVAPDGVTVLHEYAPVYPPQLPDVSYGVAMHAESTRLLDEGAPLRVLVPTDASLENTWHLPDTDDSQWLSGTTGVGFDTGGSEGGGFSSYLLTFQPVGYWRFGELSGTTAANLGTLGTAANGTYVNGPNLAAPGPGPIDALVGLEEDNSAVGLTGFSHVTTNNSLLSGRSSFTMMGFVRPSTLTANRIGLWGQNDAVEFGFISTGTLQVWTPSGGSINVAYPFPVDTWHHIVVVGTGTQLQVWMDGQLRGAGGSTTGSYGSSSFPFNIGGGGIFDASGNFFNGRIDEVAVFHRALNATEISNIYRAAQGLLAATADPADPQPSPTGPPAAVAAGSHFAGLIATDVESQMHGRNASAYLRIEFTVDDTSNIDQLLLRMKYDDGFVAYLNGQQVARRNAPETIAFNSTATLTHSNQQAVQFETIDISGGIPFLTVGRNVLAVQGLNRKIDNPDFLILPVIDALAVTVQPDAHRYFLAVTPGAPNSTGTQDVGPIIRSVQHTPAVAAAAVPIVVTAQVDAAFRDVANVWLTYRVMYGSELTIAMVDDGTGADAVSGDGIYTAVIPGSALTAGQMVRWYVTATDVDGSSSRNPLFPVRSGTRQSAQYHGTVVANPAVGTPMPVFQWFLAPGTDSAANTRAGTRTSVFYDGQFYDNIFVRLRGGSTSGFPKRNYKFQFNRGDYFRFDPNVPRVSEFNLNSTWSDKAYIRQPLSFETYRLVGSPASLSFPMRVQRNGIFDGIYIFIEQPDERLLEREGLDPEGALYKMYNSFTSGTGSVRKATRKTEPNTDLVQFIAGINSSTGDARFRFIMDNVDLPRTINYLVATTLVHQNDHPHKNHYLYRDTNGTGQWFFIPWDHDLTWGSNWVGTSTSDLIYASDDQVWVSQHNRYQAPSHPLIGSEPYREWNNNWNRLIDALFKDPIVRQMYVRRLRTMMDELLGAPGTPSSDWYFNRRVDELADHIRADVVLDMARWNPAGWAWGQNQSFQQAIDIIKNDYLARRRQHLFVTHNVANTAYGLNAGIPNAQAGNPALEFGVIEYRPASGNLDQQFVELRNPNSVAVDISGWQLTGGVRHTFRPGTVIPAGRSIYVTRDFAAFMARTSGPTKGQGLLVQGNYRGRLSQMGETINLIAANGEPVASVSYEADPTDLQRHLRVTELHYHPAAPSAEEIAAGINDKNDFEFIELTNIGNIPLDLNGVRFSRGIDFEFSGSAVTSLPPGAHVLVVKNLTAFALRHSTSGLLIAGEFAGRLDNAGERITIEDALAAVIHDFTYDDDWYPETDGPGHSLVVVDPLAATSRWDLAEGWRPSYQIGGSPGRIDLPPGDANGDRRVGLRDVLIVRNHLGLASAALWSQGDFNGDGAVTRADLVILASNYGRDDAPPASSPMAQTAAAPAAAASNAPWHDVVETDSGSGRSASMPASDAKAAARQRIRAVEQVLRSWGRDDAPQPDDSALRRARRLARAGRLLWTAANQEDRRAAD